jgi:hypothetical protein
MTQLRSARKLFLFGFVLSSWLLGSNAGWAAGASTVESRMQS